MANVGSEKHEVGESEQLRKQLAVAVRSVRWSYAIFWSLSSSQQGVLKWHDGYYNGDIKTRKTVQAEDFKPDKTGLHRSEQLRELYNSLLEGKESEEQTCNKKPPAASLSPEDLSDMEWYYLVCMSFVFNAGEELPGRALSSGETIWLCNAHYADSKVFSRSLLAKSASIQTVVCFPYPGGVIELGITELVSEDTTLLQHVKTSLLKLSKPVCSEKSSPSTHKSNDDDDQPILAKAGPDNVVHGLDSKKLYEECKLDSSEDYLINGCDQNDGMEYSTNSTSECISEAFGENQQKDKTSLTHFCLKEVQISNHTKFSSLDLGEVEQEGGEEEEEEDEHYKRTLFNILGSSPHLQGDLGFHNSGCNSSFSRWKKRAGKFQNQIMAPQRMLKKVLYRENNLKDSLSIDDETRENEKLGVLRSMLPPINKIDKASILNDTVKYLKALETRVQELEAVMEEQISDNYNKEKIQSTKKPLLNKRKAYDINETGSDVNQAGPENKMVNSEVKVSVLEKEVVIEMRCPYKEYILLDVMDVVTNLQLDAHSIQSSSLDGFLTLSLKSKVRGTAVRSAETIKRVLWNVVSK